MPFKTLLTASAILIALNVFNDWFLAKNSRNLSLFIHWWILPNWTWLSAGLVGFGVGWMLKSKGWLYGGMSAAIGLGVYFWVQGIVSGFNIDEPLGELTVLVVMIFWIASIISGIVGGLLGSFGKRMIVKDWKK